MPGWRSLLFKNNFNQTPRIILGINIIIEMIVSSITEISAIAEEGAAGTEEASASTEEQAASMEELAASALELSNIARELKSEFAKFTTQLDLKEMHVE